MEVGRHRGLVRVPPTASHAHPWTGWIGTGNGALEKRIHIHGPEPKYKGDNPLNDYVSHTPFWNFFNTSIPITAPVDLFKEHGFLFAKSGWGKSQTMRAIFTHLIKEDCALFLIDGNGGLIENIDKIAAIKDRLVILDCREKPALNFFHMTGGSREKQMELFFYLFKALDQTLTQRQATMIAYLVDLMRAIPGANLDTLRDVCQNGVQHYSSAFSLLQPIAQDYFINQFGKKDPFVNQTRQQIAQRLFTIARNQLFADMFNAPTNSFNAFDLMQQKKIVVVDASRDELGDQGSAIFQRYILAQCLAAAFQRPKNARHLALIILDEAKTSLDDQSQKILSDARAFGLGLLLCSQFPDQLEDGVRKEVINNTSIKIAGPAAFSVISQLYRDMRCEIDFILGMKKKDYHYTQWACYLDNHTPHAVKLTVPLGAVEKLPQLTDAEHRALRAANRASYGQVSTTEHVPAPPVQKHAKVDAPPPTPPPRNVKPESNDPPTSGTF